MRQELSALIRTDSSYMGFEKVNDESVRITHSRRSHLPATAPHALVAVVAAHVSMNMMMHLARPFIVWDSNMPSSNMALRIIHAMVPIIWPVTGAMCFVAICCIVFSMARHRNPVPNVAPADAAAGLLLISWATLAYAMHHATPMNPMVRIVGNPLIHLPALPAYVLLWRNDLRGRISPEWERGIIMIVGLPTLLLLIKSTFNVVGWLLRI